MVKTILLFCSLPLFLQSGGSGASASPDYKGLLATILPKLETFYASRSDAKRIPHDFITIGMAEEGVDLNRLFRNRKVEPYFIEENTEIADLHKQAGECYLNLKQYDSAIRHFYESLRFKKIEFVSDALIFYELSAAYRESGFMEGYRNALETACSLDSENASYALELGTSLYRSREKKRAILYLERYLSIESDPKDPVVYQLLAGLQIDVGSYLKAADYYRKLLAKKEDPYFRYALGNLCYSRIGNHEEAMVNLTKAIDTLPQKEVLMRQKCYEFIGDILYKNLKFADALAAYNSTIQYEKSVDEAISAKEKDLAALAQSIRELKTFLMKRKDYVKFNEYQLQNLEKEKLEYELTQENYERRRLNSGKVRWNSGECLERLERLDEAIVLFQQAADFHYRENEARTRITKLQLKIKRGY